MTLISRHGGSPARDGGFGPSVGWSVKLRSRLVQEARARPALPGCSASQLSQMSQNGDPPTPVCSVPLVRIADFAWVFCSSLNYQSCAQRVSFETWVRSAKRARVWFAQSIPLLSQPAFVALSLQLELSIPFTELLGRSRISFLKKTQRHPHLLFHSLTSKIYLEIEEKTPFGTKDPGGEKISLRRPSHATHYSDYPTIQSAAKAKKKRDGVQFHDPATAGTRHFRPHRARAGRLR